MVMGKRRVKGGGIMGASPDTIGASRPNMGLAPSPVFETISLVLKYCFSFEFWTITLFVALKRLS